jgi:hypothetical protein
MIKKRPVSQATIGALGVKEKGVIISRFPIDRYDCPCQKIVRSFMKNLNKMNESAREEWYKQNTPFQCPRSKNQKLYNLKCQNCGEIVGQVNALNLTLKNWSNLHYVSWYDREGWSATYGVNVNPYNGDIRLECCCGENKSFTSYKIEGGAIWQV